MSAPAPAPSDLDVKIVATIGPASRDPETLRRLLDAGMSVARLNFSHGTAEEHAAVIAALRDVAADREDRGRHVAILADLGGPKIRLGDLKEGEHELVEGETLTLVDESILGDATTACLTEPSLIADLRVGEPVLIDDGLLRLVVESASAHRVVLRVEDGGPLRPRKGVNLPRSQVSLPSLTDKDLDDLAFVLGQDVDYVAQSFVRSPADVLDLKREMARLGKSLPIIAKLETPPAVERLEGILDLADGVMVARGDLGVEMPPEEVPHIQKRIIRAAREHNKPVITATQMLESMIHNPRPTRAEASDVANAILDGTDAVMLSAESAWGSYPVESVEMMARIIASSRRVASERPGAVDRAMSDHALGLPQTRAVCQAAIYAALDVGARAICTYTLSGTTALVLSKYRPARPIYAFARKERTRRRMSLFRGVRPCALRNDVEHTDELIYEVERYLLDHDLVETGDVIALTSGSPLDRKRATNLLQLHTIGS